MQTAQPLHDTSHYDECRAIMQKQKRDHMKRFFIIFLIATLNGYFHIISMPLWRAEEGVVAVAIFSFAFFWGVFALLHNIAIVVLGLLASPEKPVLLWLSLALVFLGWILQLMKPIFVLIIGIMFIIGLVDSKKAAWIKEQPGYPYFNERFAEQEGIAFREYRPYHAPGDRANDDMLDIAEATDSIPTPATAEMPDVEAWIPDVSAPVKTAIHPEIVTPRHELLTDSASDVLAGIAPMYGEETEQMEREKQVLRSAQMSEPEVPKADFSVPTDIPDPVWDVPDPVLDTGSILSDVPEIAGDIQDLPDIPDIPQI